MASRGKSKTTMAKLTRERRLRERRLEKEARKAQRKQASAAPTEFGELETGEPRDVVAEGFAQPVAREDAELTSGLEDQPPARP